MSYFHPVSRNFRIEDLLEFAPEFNPISFVDFIYNEERSLRRSDIPSNIIDRYLCEIDRLKEWLVGGRITNRSSGREVAVYDRFIQAWRVKGVEADRINVLNEAIDLYRRSP
jgi:hypothetical protein